MSVCHGRETTCDANFPPKSPSLIWLYFRCRFGLQTLSQISFSVHFSIGRLRSRFYFWLQNQGRRSALRLTTVGDPAFKAYASSLCIAQRRNNYQSTQRGELYTKKAMRGYFGSRLRLCADCACSRNAVFAENVFKRSNGHDFRLLRIADRFK